MNIFKICNPYNHSILRHNQFVKKYARNTDIFVNKKTYIATKNVYKEEKQQQEATAKNSFLNKNITDLVPVKKHYATDVQLSFPEKLTRLVRQMVYRYDTGNKNELMSAEEFKNKLYNNECFSSDVYYVVYADLPKEEQAYSPQINLNAAYRHIFDPEYYGILDLSDIEITKLPDQLHVKGSVNLSKSNIYQLPQKFIVEQNLNISECHNLTTLSEGLHVKGSVDAHKSGIKKLNSKFIVGNSLNLAECIYLSEIPENPINVMADINFTGCINVKYIPSWILFINMIPTNHRMRTVFLDNIGVNSNEITSMIKKFQQRNQLFVDIRY